MGNQFDRFTEEAKKALMIAEQEAKKEGVFCTIQKPFSIKEVIATVEKVIKKRKGN